MSASEDHISDVYDSRTGLYLHLNLPPLSKDYDGSGLTTAVVDSGVLSEHPDIRPRLVESVDFTGEGPEDRIGHGTKVALIVAADAPAVQIVNVKVLGQINSKVDWLIAGLRWVGQHPLINVANVSAGV